MTAYIVQKQLVLEEEEEEVNEPEEEEIKDMSDGLDSDEEELLYSEEEEDELSYPASGGGLLCQFFRSWHGTVFLYLGLLLISAFSLISLLVIYIHVVLPYCHFQHYAATSCSSVALSGLRTNTCLCGISCKSKYRCIAITVTYQTRNKVWRNATLYDNEYAMDQKEVNLYNHLLAY